MKKEVKNEFCPECGIGLSTQEMHMGFCQNCKASWEKYEEERQRVIKKHTKKINTCN